MQVDANLAYRERVRGFIATTMIGADAHDTTLLFGALVVIDQTSR